MLGILLSILAKIDTGAGEMLLASLIILILSISRSEMFKEHCHLCGQRGICYTENGVQHCLCSISAGLYMPSKACTALKSYCDNINCSNRAKCVSTFGGYNCVCTGSTHGQKCQKTAAEPGVSKYLKDVHVFYKFKDVAFNTRTMNIIFKEVGDKFVLKVKYGTLYREWSATDLKKIVPFEACKKYVSEHNVNNEEICFGLHRGMAEYYQATLEIDFPIAGEGIEPIEIDSELVGRIDYVSIEAFNGASQEYKRKYIVSTIYENDFQCNVGIDLLQCSTDYLHPVVYPRSEKIILRSIVLTMPDSCPYIAKMSFEWTFYKDDKLHIQNKTEAKVYTIERYSFDAGFYRVKVFANVLGSTEKASKAALEIHHNHGTIIYHPLVAKLLGGPEVTLTEGTTLTLDASESEDPNHLTKEFMLYEWSCTQSNPVCSPKTTKDPVYKVEGLKGEYTFSLTVKSTKEGILPGTTTQKVRVTPGTSSDLTLICNHNCLRVNRFEVVRLSITSRSEKPVDLKDISIVYTQNNGPETSADTILQPGITPFSYIIKPRSLAEGALYEFALKDTSGNKITSLTLETNDRPQKGSCQIDPPNGTVLMTEFNIKCSGFKDRDEVTVSLLYELYEIKSDTPTDTLLAYSYKPYFKGIRLTSSNIKIRVTDMYGLYVDELPKLTLASANLDDEKIEEVLNSISRTILEDGDQSLAVQQIVGVVNSVTTLQNKESLVDNLIEKLTQLNEYVIKDVLQVSTAADKLLTRTVREEKDGLTTHSIMAVGSLLKKISGSFLAEALVEKHITMKDIKTVSTCIFNCIEKVIVSRDKSLTEPFADPEVYETNFYQVQKGTEGMIKALDNIADSLISVIVTAESDIGVQSGSMSMRSLVETPEQLSASNGFVVGNSIFKMDKELAEHYKGQKLGVTMVSMDKDPMWWDPEKPKINSNVAFVKLNLMEGGKTKPIRQLPSPFDLILKVEDKMTAPQIIKGEVEKAPEEMSLYDKDTYVAIHRIEVDDDFEGELTIEFENISPANELRALVLNDKNPDYILVAKGQIITSASSVIKQTISRKDENSFFYLGIIPAEKFATGQKISYTFKVKHKMCKTWDGKRWKSESCMVATGKDDNSVHCRCTHLSMFGSSLFVPPNRLNPIEDIVLFLDVVNNMYVVVLVSVFVLFYIIVLLWACRKDRKDIRERGIIELEDNCPGETQGYLCAVYTGANISAGTTANVAIKLVGSAGSSRVHILGCSGFRTLQTGQDNWFLMFTQRRLGRLKYIHLWHDNSGSSPDWYCDKILVYDLETKAEYIFLVRRWLSVLETDDKLEYKISCASESDLKNWNTLTKENLQLGFRETHLWISVFIRHPRSAFSRSQRLSVAMCMIMTNMLVSLLFYGAAKTTYADDPSYSLGLREIIVSIESALITVPLTFMVAFCFKKSRPTYETNLYETDAPKDGKAGKKKWTISNCCKNPEIIFTMLGNAVELRPLLPASLNETDKRQRRMRQFWFIAAWSFCMGVILVSSFFIMLLGLKVGANRSLLWMSAILIGFFQGIFIAQPLKIVIIALALGLIFKKRPRTTLYTLHANNGIPVQLQKDSTFMTNMIRRRTQSMYRPLTDDEVNVERMKRSKSEAEKRILFASIVTLFVLVLFIIISRMQIKETNESSNHVKNLVTMKDKYNTTNLEEIYTTAMFYEYFKTSLFPEIHAVKWYNDRLLDMEGEVEDGKNNSLNKFTGWTSDYSSKLVGVIRIRQHRVKTNSCLVPALFSKIFHTCNIALNTYSEDIARYGVGWKRSDKIDPGSSSWAYTSQWESETNGMFGKSGLYYYGGGYIANLGHAKRDSLIALTQLKLEGWIDNFTRAIFIEFNLYNANMNLFSAVTVLIEQFSSGIYLPKVQVVGAHLIYKEERLDPIFIMAAISVIALQITITAIAVKNISRHGITKYLLAWNFKTEILVVIFGLATISAYVIRLLYYSVYINLFEAAEGNTFVSFNTPLHYNYVLQICVGILIAMAGTHLLLLLTFDSESTLIRMIFGAKFDAGIILIISLLLLGVISGIAFLNESMLFKLISSPILNAQTYKIIMKNALFGKGFGFALLYSLFFFIIKISLLAILIYYYEVGYKKTSGSGYQSKMRKLLGNLFNRKVKSINQTEEKYSSTSVNMNKPHARVQAMRMLFLMAVGHNNSDKNRTELMTRLALLYLDNKMTGNAENRDFIADTTPDLLGGTQQFYYNIQQQIQSNEEQMQTVIRQLNSLNRNQQITFYYLKHKIRKEK